MAGTDAAAALRLWPVARAAKKAREATGQRANWRSYRGDGGEGCGGGGLRHSCVNWRCILAPTPASEKTAVGVVFFFAYQKKVSSSSSSSEDRLSPLQWAGEHSMAEPLHIGLTSRHRVVGLAGEHLGQRKPCAL